MPRELESSEDTLEGLAPLQPQSNPRAGGRAVSRGSRMQREMRQEAKLNQLMPYTLSLTVQDVPQCEIVENEAFPPHERCSHEKFIYRLRNCAGLCYGLFTTVDPDSDSEDKNAPTYRVAPKAESDFDRRRVLLGHVIATLTTNEVIKDEDMALPSDWDSKSPAPSNLGHKETGRTLCIHSLAVLPDYQNKGVGTNLMTGYIKRIKDSQICDRIALLAEDTMVPFYDALGFDNVGKSEATFGGVPWNDMVYDFTTSSPDSNPY